jgi:L-lactate dehydrogenase (cytochrome)/(S)-mandelate dehydrogenase
MAVDRAVTIEDLRQLALRRLPYFISQYVEQTSGDGGGITRNIAAFRNYQLIPRGLLEVTPVDTTAELFGRKYASLFGISAVGTGGIYRRHFDEILAEVAREANLPYILSSSATASIETISRIAPDHTWFQLYGARTEALTDHMIGRAKDCGVKVLVLTVDYPIRPRSEVAERTGVALASGPTLRTFPRLFWDALRHPSWTAEFLSGGGTPKLESWATYAPPGSSSQEVAKFYFDNWVSNQTWRDLDRVRKLWQGALVVKGLVHPDDVARAVEAGANAVTISNHGGNKLDCMQAALDSLIAARKAVGPHVRLFFDGGIRRGSDLIVAKALGADHCFIGRATIYGTAAGGRKGAQRAVDILQRDLAYTMAMIGCRTNADITREHVTAA